MECGVHGRHTAANLQLATSCTGTDVENDHAHLYMAGTRTRGTMMENRGGAGVLELVGGPCGFAG